jgi:hypothetical protein
VQLRHVSPRKVEKLFETCPTCGGLGIVRRVATDDIKSDDIEHPSSRLISILVRQVTGDAYKVICGATRLKAARYLGWYDIFR